jgi:hypothetical protein
MRESVRRFLFGPVRRILVMTTGIVAVGLALLWLASSPVLASIVSGRVLVDGKPVESAHLYLMPCGNPQAYVEADGHYDIEIPLLHLLEYGMTVEVCAVLPDGRRTYFGEHLVSLWPCARRSRDIELGDHVPPPWSSSR